MRLGAASRAFPRASPQYGGDDDGPLRLLVEAGLQLASERSLAGLAQTAVDGGLPPCCPRLGIIVYPPHADDGETYELCRYAGINEEEARRISPLTHLDSLIPSHF